MCFISNVHACPVKYISSFMDALLLSRSKYNSQLFYSMRIYEQSSDSHSNFLSFYYLQIYGKKKENKLYFPAG